MQVRTNSVPKYRFVNKSVEHQAIHFRLAFPFYLYIFFFYSKTFVCYLVCSTILFLNFLSIIFTLQPVIFIILRSSSKWSIQIKIFLLTCLVPYCFHSIIFLVGFVLAIPITWATHHILCHFINFIKNHSFIFYLKSSFVLNLYVPPGVC